MALWVVSTDRWFPDNRGEEIDIEIIDGKNRGNLAS